MQQEPTVLARSPLWLIKSGTATLGPFATAGLLGALEGGKLGSDCSVKQVGWPHFRPVGQIREVGEWRRHQALGGGAAASAPTPLDFVKLCSPRDEATLVALHAAATLSRADVAVAYRVLPPFWLPVATFCYGDVDVLGIVLRADDPVVERTRQRGAFAGAREAGAAETAAAIRLTKRGTCPVLAVAVLPVHVNGILLGLIELGRFDHLFRSDDFERIRSVGRSLGSRFDGSGVPPSAVSRTP